MSAPILRLIRNHKPLGFSTQHLRTPDTTSPTRGKSTYTWSQRLSDRMFLPRPSRLFIAHHHETLTRAQALLERAQSHTHAFADLTADYEAMRNVYAASLTESTGSNTCYGNPTWGMDPANGWVNEEEARKWLLGELNSFVRAMEDGIEKTRKGERVVENKPVLG